MKIKNVKQLSENYYSFECEEDLFIPTPFSLNSEYGVGNIYMVDKKEGNAYFCTTLKTNSKEEILISKNKGVIIAMPYEPK